VAYQGYGRELGVERVRDLSLWATGGLLPDLTIVLDIDPSIGLSRVQAPDRLESEPVDYHRRVRQAFLEIASTDPDKYLVIDASEAADVIAARIAERVSELMERSR
ncbi:MAG: dTMP kinase, partial [Actinomycetota bacterium]|nr:dTMP kinase [Actinomycetota bacterium]